MAKTVHIIAAKRTPIGSFQGTLSSLSAPELGGWAIAATLEQASEKLPSSTSLPFTIDEVYMGCVLTAGCGQAPARQAAIQAGLSYATPCTTVNKVCGSGMKTVMMAFDQILLGHSQCIIAGGMESMTNAPYLLPQARQGFRAGHKTAQDHMFFDGLQDAYEGHLMGVYGQATADEQGFSREQMDAWAIRSAERAKAAQSDGRFMDEIVPVVLAQQQKSHSKSGYKSIPEIVSDDEHPNEIQLDKIPKLKPAFVSSSASKVTSDGESAGSITAANSSAISDGAAALMLIDSDLSIAHQILPLAILHGHATHAREPAEFTLAPQFACHALLDKLGWSVEKVDRWEINEAFAVVTQVAIKGLGIDEERVNVNGGACALGHPIGASGTRIIVTLIHALQQLQQQLINQGENRAVYGVASLCIGGGEATAVAIELPKSAGL
ncbi:acetyl-CoA acetyltransferase [Photobacterium jeanii]|uniref:Acetyl-CoA acetyltransferase n=1 Tax=Photobacterium jeanii TaxID=858640 RepID=A0A178K746_9GAMM|nr:thiolase family protein [Photobacterium jeanii]OAN13150.1 acetyl-CoA acetyltransferase [Photobacterium jeanii]PST89302.1 acetyl-CoA C-acyltransferase [Photobacterium jeanii]